MQGIAKQTQEADRIPHRGQRGAFQLDDSLHSPQGVAEQKAHSSTCAEQISEHRESATLNPREEECGPTGPVDAPLHGAHLQSRIDFPVDTDKFSVTLKVPDALLKITVPHADTFSPQTTSSIKRRYCGFPEDMICVIDF